MPATAYVHLGLSGLLCERNNLNEAAHHLAQGLDLAQQWQIGEALRDGYVFQARLKQTQGEMAGALDALREGDSGGAGASTYAVLTRSPVMFDAISPTTTVYVTHPPR